MIHKTTQRSRYVIQYVFQKENHKTNFFKFAWIWWTLKWHQNTTCFVTFLFSFNKKVSLKHLNIMCFLKKYDNIWPCIGKSVKNPGTLVRKMAITSLIVVRFSIPNLENVQEWYTIHISMCTDTYRRSFVSICIDTRVYRFSPSEHPSKPMWDIVHTKFLYMTCNDLDLWPHDLQCLISSSTLHRE